MYINVEPNHNKNQDNNDEFVETVQVCNNEDDVSTSCTAFTDILKWRTVAVTLMVRGVLFVEDRLHENAFIVQIAVCGYT